MVVQVGHAFYMLAALKPGKPDKDGEAQAFCLDDVGDDRSDRA